MKNVFLFELVFVSWSGALQLLEKMAYRLAMGDFSHVDGRAERRGRDDEEEGYDRLPRKGLANVPPLLAVKYYRMNKVGT